MPKKTKMEFSKKILIVAGTINIIVIAFTIYMIWKTWDMTPLAYLIPAVAAEVATGTGFYYSKARTENAIKLKNAYNMSDKELTDALKDYKKFEDASSI